MSNPTNNGESKEKRRAPARTLEAREQRLISLATDLAEKQLAEGTASSQVITHYLKLGTTTSRIEKDILLQQKELISAKTESIKSGRNIEALYKEAMAAMRAYSGQTVAEDVDVD